MSGYPAELTRFLSGANIPGTDVWLDPPRRVPFAIWCNPATVGIRNQPKLLCTDLAARLLGTARPLRNRAPLVTPYGRVVQVGPLHITLHPAGYCLGDAQTRIRHEKQTYWYTGPRSTRSALLDVADDPEPCHHIVLATDTMAPSLTYTDPQLTLDVLCNRISEIAANQMTPIVVCTALGDAQEIAHGLFRRSLVYAAHKAIRRYNKIYRQHGLEVPDVAVPATPKPRFTPVLWPDFDLERLTTQPLANPAILVVGPRPLKLPVAWGHVEHVEYCRGPTLNELEEVLTQTRPESIRICGPLQELVARALQQRVRKMPC